MGKITVASQKHRRHKDEKIHYTAETELNLHENKGRNNVCPKPSRGKDLSLLQVERHRLPGTYTFHLPNHRNQHTAAEPERLEKRQLHGMP